MQHRLAGLDALRFAAATGVVTTHYGMWLAPHGTGFFKCLGFCSVSAFFIISGLVITPSANAAKSRAVFLMRRFERLFPAFFLCLLLSFAFRLKSGQPTGLQMFLGNLTMLPTLLHIPEINGVYWTLSFEWMFYFIVAANLRNFRSRPNIFILCWLVAAICVRESGTHWRLLNIGASCTYTPFFCAGIIFSKWLSKEIKPLQALMFITGITVFFGLFGLPDALSQPYLVFVYICIFLLCIFIVLVCLVVNVTGRYCNICFLAGGVSYPLYLDHGISLSTIGGFLTEIRCPAIPSFIACISLAVFLGWMINQFFEIPVMARLRRLSDRTGMTETRDSAAL